MEKFIVFFSMSNPNIRYVVIGAILLTASSAIIGCFTLLRKRALVGDVVAHSVLPGICLSFLMTGTKDPFLLLIGAFVTGWLSLVFMDFITRKTKLKEDTAIGLVLSVFFGIGILLLTAIQQTGYAAQTGLETFLFGKAASIVESDIMVFGTVGLLLIAAVIIFFKDLALVSFDPAFAHSIGYPVKALELLLTTLTVLAVVVGIQATGVVLMAAMLITPAAAARFWTNNLRLMLVLAALLGAFSGVSGAYISFVFPAMPTGPWIVTVVSVIALGSFLLAPGKGILARMKLQNDNRKRITDENILKVFFHLGEKNQYYFEGRSIDDLMQKRDFSPTSLKLGLKRLRSDGYLKKEQGLWKLTPEGKEQGQRVTRLHRLWEMYLTKYMDIAPDHVHDDAETMEHIITPELEKKLEELLEYPEQDPHDSKIPYRS